MMTLKEIAAKAGVSISTVSRVLNNTNTSAASPEVKSKILEIVRESNYATPSQKTQRLVASNPVIACFFARGTKTMTENPFFYGIAQNFEQLVMEAGYSTKHFFATETIEEENLERLASERISGIVVIGRHRSEIIPKIHSIVPNIVYTGLMPPASDLYDCVVCDAYRIGKTATSYLLSKGHRDIGYIGDVDNEIRYTGYIDTLAEHCISPKQEWIADLPSSMENGYEGMKRILSHPKHPSAVFCMNDYAAIGAMKAAHDMGLRVCEDIAIIGVDNTEAGGYTTPKLTTIHTPMAELGQIAAKVLLDRIQGGHSITMKVELPFKLIQREST